MTKKYLEEPKADMVIKGTDGKEWPIDQVRDLYTKNDWTIENMARDLKLPKAQLERLARTGVHSWNKLKRENRERWLATLSERFDDTLLEKQSIVQRLEEVTLMEMAHRIKEIEDHYSRWGDFFARDAEFEILRDGKGQAIRLQLPNSPKDLLILKGLEDAKVTNARLLGERLEALEQKSNASAINVDTYDLFERKDD